MTLRAFYGFDDTQTTAVEPGVTLGTSATTGTSGRTGPGALAVGSTVSTLALSGSSATMFTGAAHKANTFGAAECVRFMEGAIVHCGWGFDASGHVTIYGAAGTVVATSTYALAVGVWASFEAKAVIADSGGTVEVKADGVSIVTFTGDTKNAGTGIVDTIGVIRTSNSHLMDDFYACDAGGSAPYNTYLGDVAVRLLLPSGNGSNSDWVNSAGTSVNNYTYVDEANPSATDYVGTALTGKTDLYAMGDIPTTDLPLATQVMVYAAKSDAGTPPVMKPVTKGDGGTVLEESAVTLSTTYQHFAGAIRTTDPDGDALTATNVNGMQAGVRSA